MLDLRWQVYLATLRHATRCYLLTFQPSRRPWLLSLTGALTIGLPLLLAAGTAQVGAGMVATLGTLTLLYLPATNLPQRILTLMCCGFGLVATVTLGLLSQQLPASMPLLLMMMTVLASMLCRYYRLPPPGSYFFILVAAIAMYMPTPLADIPRYAGLVVMGSLLACILGALYSLHAWNRHPPLPAPDLPAPEFDFIVVDSLIIGLAVGLSLFLADCLQMDRPYWTATTCLAILQATTLQAVWHRQWQRLLGTCMGLLLTWLLFSLPLTPWLLAVLVVLLSFTIESLVVHHYGLAMIFITPLALLLGEATSLSHLAVFPLITARFHDTLLGGITGLLGGYCLQQPVLRQVVNGLLRPRLIPPEVK